MGQIFSRREPRMNSGSRNHKLKSTAAVTSAEIVESVSLPLSLNSATHMSQAIEAASGTKAKVMIAEPVLRNRRSSRP